jgi:hypothetical protein
MAGASTASPMLPAIAFARNAIRSKARYIPGWMRRGISRMVRAMRDQRKAYAIWTLLDA